MLLFFRYTPYSGTSWLAVVDTHSVVPRCFEGITHINVPSTLENNTKPGDSLTLVVSETKTKPQDSVIGVSKSKTVIYRRHVILFLLSYHIGISINILFSFLFIRHSIIRTSTNVTVPDGDRKILPSITSNTTPTLPLTSYGAGGWSGGQKNNHSPKLPTEVCEAIIDRVAYMSGQKILARCCLVCRAWVPRTQMHLFSFVECTFKEDYHSIVHSVRQKPFLLRYIKSLWANNYNMPRATNVLATHHVPSMQLCSIVFLDLQIVHPTLYRFPSSTTSLRILQLILCKTRDVNQLCRFLTSYPCLYWYLSGSTLWGSMVTTLHIYNSIGRNARWKYWQ